MDKETQMIVDKLDFFRDAIVHHDEYKTHDLIHWLAVAGDMIEELAGVKEQLSGMEIMLTRAQSAAETWERKCREQCSWISVEERLPEYGRYLVITLKGNAGPKVHTATYNHMGWWTHSNFGDITHWMPLPELPKEKS